MPTVAGAASVVGAGWATYRALGRWAKYNDADEQRMEDDELVARYEQTLQAAATAAAAADDADGNSDAGADADADADAAQAAATEVPPVGAGAIATGQAHLFTDWPRMSAGARVVALADVARAAAWAGQAKRDAPAVARRVAAQGAQIARGGPALTEAMAAPTNSAPGTTVAPLMPEWRKLGKPEDLYRAAHGMDWAVVERALLRASAAADDTAAGVVGGEEDDDEESSAPAAALLLAAAAAAPRVWQVDEPLPPVMAEPAVARAAKAAAAPAREGLLAVERPAAAALAEAQAAVGRAAGAAAEAAVPLPESARRLRALSQALTSAGLNSARKGELSGEVAAALRELRLEGAEGGAAARASAEATLDAVVQERLSDRRKALETRWSQQARAARRRELAAEIQRRVEAASSLAAGDTAGVLAAAADEVDAILAEHAAESAAGAEEGAEEGAAPARLAPGHMREALALAALMGAAAERATAAGAAAEAPAGEGEGEDGANEEEDDDAADAAAAAALAALQDSVEALQAALGRGDAAAAGDACAAVRERAAAALGEDGEAGAAAVANAAAEAARIEDERLAKADESELETLATGERAALVAERAAALQKKKEEEEKEEEGEDVAADEAAADASSSPSLPAPERLFVREQALRQLGNRPFAAALPILQGPLLAQAGLLEQQGGEGALSDESEGAVARLRAAVAEFGLADRAMALEIGPELPGLLIDVDAWLAERQARLRQEEEAAAKAKEEKEQAEKQEKEGGEEGEEEEEKSGGGDKEEEQKEKDEDAANEHAELAAALTRARALCREAARDPLLMLGLDRDSYRKLAAVREAAVAAAAPGAARDALRWDAALRALRTAAEQASSAGGGPEQLIEAAAEEASEAAKGQTEENGDGNDTDESASALPLAPADRAALLAEQRGKTAAMRAAVSALLDFESSARAPLAKALDAVRACAAAMGGPLPTPASVRAALASAEEAHSRAAEAAPLAQAAATAAGEAALPSDAKAVASAGESAREAADAASRAAESSAALAAALAIYLDYSVLRARFLAQRRKAQGLVLPRAAAPAEGNAGGEDDEDEDALAARDQAELALALGLVPRGPPSRRAAAAAEEEEQEDDGEEDDDEDEDEDEDEEDEEAAAAAAAAEAGDPAEALALLRARAAAVREAEDEESVRAAVRASRRLARKLRAVVVENREEEEEDDDDDDDGGAGPAAGPLATMVASGALGDFALLDSAADVDAPHVAAWRAAGLREVAKGRVAAVIWAHTMVPRGSADEEEEAGKAAPAPAATPADAAAAALAAAAAPADPAVLVPVAGLPSRKSPLQLACERLLKLDALAAAAAAGGVPGSRRGLPLVLVASPRSYAPLRRALRSRRNFGLLDDQVRVVVAAPEAPAFGGAGGGGLAVLQASALRLAASPAGAGDVFSALSRSGALAWLRARGVQHLEVNSLDRNALARPADPVFVGWAAGERLSAAAKVVEPSDAAAALALAAGGGGSGGGNGSGDGNKDTSLGASLARAALRRSLARVAPAVGSYYFSVRAAQALAKHHTLHPLADYTLLPAAGVLARDPAAAQQAALAAQQAARAAQQAQAQAGGAGGGAGGQQAGLNAYLAKMQAQRAAQQAQAAAQAAQRPSPVDGYYAQRRLSSLLGSAGLEEVGGAQCVGLLAVSASDELALAGGIGGGRLGGPRRDAVAGAELLAAQGAWVECAGAGVGARAGVEVSPLVSYGGEGLAGVAARGGIVVAPRRKGGRGEDEGGEGEAEDADDDQPVFDPVLQGCDPEAAGSARRPGKRVMIPLAVGWVLMAVAAAAQAAQALLRTASDEAAGGGGGGGAGGGNGGLDGARRRRRVQERRV
jgi:hypothetical protein